MKNCTLPIVAFFILLFSSATYAQNPNGRFKMEGPKSETIELNESFSSSQEIFPFDKNREKIYGLAVSAQINLENEESVVRLLLVDTNFEEHLIYESYALLEETLSFPVDEICEETAIMEGVRAHSVKIEVTGAQVHLQNFTVSKQIDPAVKIAQVKKEKKQQQNKDKINRINKALKSKGMKWVAGPTSVSELSYSERKKLYGQSTFPPAFEYYSGGIISATSSDSEGTELKSATASTYVEEWDWRNRHGKNWISPIVNQGLCGSCWAFAAAGATEAMTNLYFNQLINLDLSEQELISCSDAGSCSGGYPYRALDYIKNNGIGDEAAFPYAEDDLACTSKSSNSAELIKISGRYDFGSSMYPKTEDVLKEMLITMGPLSSGLADWIHAMVLVGYKVVKEGDTFFYRDLDLKRYWTTVTAGDPLIGKTVWIYKNSWGSSFGDEGYIYVETPITNVSWTHGLKMPVTSGIKNYQVVCEDKDGDGYYWWGLGEKPATCSGPDEPDGDDSDPTLGPIDQYGNCRILTGTPTADFSATHTLVTEGETVNFTSLSSANTQTWSWVFEGGTPGSSNLQNPAVTYSTPGVYNVTLTVSNANGSDTKTVADFLTVEQAEDPVVIDEPVIDEPVIDEPVIIDEEENAAYCTSKGDATEEWIAAVSIGSRSATSGSSGIAGYQDYTSRTAFNATAGSTVQVTLTPAFLNRWQRQYWRIWIDYNGDADFNDPGELVFTSAISKGEVYGSFTPPAGINTTTRMRISMKRNGLPSSCESFSKGEVEDYTITVEAPAPQPPAAAFTASHTSITVGGVVSFTDRSSNAPTQWQWQFPGGTPSASTAQHPTVTYNSAGEYDVILTVSKEGFEPSQTIKTRYIAASEEAIVNYCIPLAVNSTSDYIRNIIIGNAYNSSTAGSGYSLAASAISLAPGGYYEVSLTPQDWSNRNYWRIWADFNGDGDFSDSNETLLSVNNKKGLVTAGITLPQNVSGYTRLRIAMRSKTEPTPCDDGYEGDVKDFTISFDAAPQAAEVATGNELLPGNPFFVKMYPNPVWENLAIEVNEVEPGDTYTLYNLNGGKLKSGNILSERTIVDLSEQAPGIYLMVVERSNLIVREKITKQ